MLQIQVTGNTGDNTSEIIDILEAALKAAGKNTVTVRKDLTYCGFISAKQIVLFEEVRENCCASGQLGVNFDFLVGLTESAAYEMAQDHGYVVRIVQRNNIPMVCTQDVKDNRVNLKIVNNVVASWYIG